MPFTVLTLGGAQVEGPSGPLAGRAAHRRRIALLALLASSPTGSLTREKITGYLWAEHEADRARHLLSVSLSALRKQLGEGAFLAAGDELSLNPELVTSDVAAFEAALRAGDARRAVELYRGPFLDGFHVADAPAFEQWTETERDRLSRAFAGALGRLAAAAEAEGDAAGAAVWWQRLAAHDPYSRRVALGVMRALDAAGERVPAIRHAAAHARVLREELGMEPDAEVEALAASLRASPVPGPAVPPAADLEDEPGTGGAPPPPATEPGTEGTTARAPARRRSPGRWLRPGLVARLAIVAAGVLVTTAVTLRLRPSAPAETHVPANRIAVLYFDNQSSDRDLGYLVNDLTENLIHRLARVEGLYVVSPGGVRPYRDRAVAPDSIRRALEVGTLVSASLQLSGDSLRLAVHLIDANTGEELDGTVIERPLGERFALGDDLAAEVAEFLRVRLGKAVQLRQWTAGTGDDRARELLSRAVEMREKGLEVASRPDPVALLTARRMLDIADSMLARAGALDPRWAEPSVKRGRLALDRIQLTDMRRKRAWTRLAREHAERALAVQPAYPPALEIRGTAAWMQADDSIPPEKVQALVRSAEADLRAATAGDPSLASAWSTLSEVLRFKPDLVEAEFAARQAYEKDAYLRDVDLVLERLYRITLILERPDEATRWCELGHAKFPDSWRFVQCQLIILSHPSARRPDAARALRLLDELAALDPPEKARLAGRPYHPIYRTMKAAVVLARDGQERRARALLARARRDAGSDPALRLFLSYDEAYLRLVLGEKERAFELLKRYVAARRDLKAYVLRDPQFSELWGDPAYAARALAW